MKEKLFIIISMFLLLACSNQPIGEFKQKTDLEKIGAKGNIEYSTTLVCRSVVDSSGIEQGEIISKKELDSIGLYNPNITNTYNKYGNIIKREFLEQDKSIYQTITYEYDDNNRLKEYNVFEKSEKQSTSEVVYDKKGFIKKEIRYFTDGTYTTEYNHTRANKNNIIETTITLSIFKVRAAAKMIYEEDSIGILSHLTYMKGELTKGVYMQRQNPDNHYITQVKTLTEEKEIIENYKDIDFDEYGNYTKTYVYVRNSENEELDESKLKYILIRDIKYFNEIQN